jgi:hypothetical protein
VGFRDALAFIKEKAARYRPESIAIEAVQYQATVVEELLRSTDLPIRRASQDKDKLTRAQGLITRYENGLVRHADHLPKYLSTSCSRSVLTPSTTTWSTPPSTLICKRATSVALASCLRTLRSLRLCAPRSKNKCEACLVESWDAGRAR